MEVILYQFLFKVLFDITRFCDIGRFYFKLTTWVVTFFLDGLWLFVGCLVRLGGWFLRLVNWVYGLALHHLSFLLSIAWLDNGGDFHLMLLAGVFRSQQLRLWDRFVALSGSDNFGRIIWRRVVVIVSHAIPHGDPILDVHPNKNLLYKYQV